MSINKSVTHSYINRRNPFGGTLHTTRCGRMALPANDTRETSGVTCKLCLRILSNLGARRIIPQGLTIATAEEAGRKAYEEATKEGRE
jgi:hypothetical protein